MTLLQSLILGTIQGLTEFIPISSSGHLVLIPEIFGWDQQPTSFDIVMHAATLLALIIFFRKDLGNLVKQIKTKSKQKLALNLVIVTIPIGLTGFLFENLIEQYFKSIQVVALMLILVGLVFVIFDKISINNKKNISEITSSNSLAIGLSQVLSLIRGTSRSGITIIGGISQKLSLSEATRFSFLAGIPIMTIVSLYQFYKFQSSGFGELQLVNLMAGFTAAFTSGLIAISWMMKFVKRRGLVAFGVYRIILGIVIIFLFII